MVRSKAVASIQPPPILFTTSGSGGLLPRSASSSALIAKLLRAYAANPAAIEGYGIHFSNYRGQRMLSSNTSWGGINVTVQIVPEERFARKAQPFVFR